MFDAPRRSDSPNAQRETEWRATYEGTADFTLSVKAQSSRMARIVFTQRISDSGASDAPPFANTID
jgi:hypothetical protein